MTTEHNRLQKKIKKFYIEGLDDAPLMKQLALVLCLNNRLTGDAFETFVQEAKDSKKIVTLPVYDTTFLHRFKKPSYGACKNEEHKTPWYEANEIYFRRYEGFIIYKNWSAIVDKSHREYHSFLEKIETDYKEDPIFKYLVDDAIEKRHNKSVAADEKDRSYLLEECAAQKFLPKNITHDSEFNPCIAYTIKKYQLKVNLWIWGETEFKPANTLAKAPPASNYTDIPRATTMGMGLFSIFANDTLPANNGAQDMTMIMMLSVILMQTPEKEKSQFTALMLTWLTTFSALSKIPESDKLRIIEKLEIATQEVKKIYEQHNQPAIRY